MSGTIDASLASLQYGKAATVGTPLQILDLQKITDYNAFGL